MGLVRIADEVEAFVAAAATSIEKDARSESWRDRVDKMLGEMSWDRTWARMDQAMARALERRLPGRLTG
jgi:hypothetical protein